jgi:Na+/proline symporter
VLIIPLAVQWWASWYPGAEPGGGSYIAQRMLAAKNEKHAMAATLTFNVLHYGLRTWPWLIVALASTLVFPKLADIKTAFPHVQENLVGHDMAYPAMLKFLPEGFLGLMAASLLAAYVSTIATHLNWGASYLVHDFYQRFVKPDASQRHYINVSRVVTAALMLLGAAMMTLMETSQAGFNLLLSIGAGTGMIYLLRWFWWRINAWSEIAAMISSFVVSAGLFAASKAEAGFIERWTQATQLDKDNFALIVNVAVTTVVWLLVTYATPATDRETLVNFYRRVRPFGPGWERIRKEAGLGPSPDSFAHSLLGWFLGCVMIYAALFGTGSFLYGNNVLGAVYAVIFAVSAAGLMWLIPVMFASEPPEGEADKSGNQVELTQVH